MRPLIILNAAAAFLAYITLYSPQKAGRIVYLFITGIAFLVFLFVSNFTEETPPVSRKNKIYFTLAFIVPIPMALGFNSKIIYLEIAAFILSAAVLFLVWLYKIKDKTAVKKQYRVFGNNKVITSKFIYLFILAICVPFIFLQHYLGFALLFYALSALESMKLI